MTISATAGAEGEGGDGEEGDEQRDGGEPKPPGHREAALGGEDHGFGGMIAEEKGPLQFSRGLEEIRGVAHAGLDREVQDVVEI